jgi:hypothetical protein
MNILLLNCGANLSFIANKDQCNKYLIFSGKVWNKIWFNSYTHRRKRQRSLWFQSCDFLILNSQISLFFYFHNIKNIFETHLQSPHKNLHWFFLPHVLKFQNFYQYATDIVFSIMMLFPWIIVIILFH